MPAEGQLEPCQLTDITRGAKAKPPQSLTPRGKGKGMKGKGGGGGASQPTTYHDAQRMLGAILPEMRANAERATKRQLAAAGHSHASQVQVGGVMAFPGQKKFIDRVIDYARERKRLRGPPYSALAAATPA